MTIFILDYKLCYSNHIFRIGIQEVESTTASSYAEEIGAMYLETSAKDDLNVQDVFVKLSEPSL